MAINAKRLLRLADYLETVPRDHFDMGTWGGKSSCGFSGCAMGWAVHGRLFRGLKSASYLGRRACPSFNGATGFEAAAELFDITIDQAEEKLFGPHIKGTPKQVAKRIRKFVRDNQAPPVPGGA